MICHHIILVYDIFIGNVSYVHNKIGFTLQKKWSSDSRIDNLEQTINVVIVSNFVMDKFELSMDPSDIFFALFSLSFNLCIFIF